MDGELVGILVEGVTVVGTGEGTAVAAVGATVVGDMVVGESVITGGLVGVDVEGDVEG